MARRARGYKTRKAAAERFGWSVNTLTQHENGLRGFGRMSRDYARAFRVSEAWLLTGEGQMNPEPKNTDHLSIEGVIQAGNWLDTSLFDEDHGDEFGVKETIPVGIDPNFPKAKQYALKVLGDSMNLEYPEGCYAICVDLLASKIPLQDGLVVHVERRRGALSEVTLKQIEVTSKGMNLIPRSTNPRHLPVPLEGDDSTEIVVRGVVLGSYRPSNIVLQPRILED